MAASFPFAAMLAIACFFVAALPTSAAPAMTTEMGPHDVIKDSKMATKEATSDKEIEKLQEALAEYIIGQVREITAQLAADTTTKPAVLVEIECNIHRRCWRSADSTPGYSGGPLEVHAGNLSSDPIAEFTGYTANDSAPSHDGNKDLHGIAKYAPAHYIPSAARALARNRALAKATTLAPSPLAVPTPTQAHSPASAPVPTLASAQTLTLEQTAVSAPARVLAHTAASAQASTLENTAVSAPATALAHTPAFASSPVPENPKSILEIWNQFLAEPLQKNYDKFVAHLPAKSVRSLLLDRRHFDFRSVQDYRVDKEGFLAAMQKVYQVPKEQLGEVGDFYDMMTKVLPYKFYGKGRSVADLIRQIRFYFARKHPSVKVMVPDTVAQYYLK